MNENDRRYSNGKVNSSGTQRPRVNGSSDRPVQRPRPNGGGNAGQRPYSNRNSSSSVQRTQAQHSNASNARAEAARRRKKAELARKKRRRKVMILRSIIAAAVLLIILVVVLFTNSVKNRVYVDINTTNPVSGEDFANISFLSCEITDGAESVDYTKAGEYPVTVKSMGISHKAFVVVEDKNPPYGEAVEVRSATGTEIDASKFVTNISDESEVTVKYKNTPDFSKDGTQDVTVTLTDESGNVTEIKSSVTLYSDTEPPVINGVSDIHAYLGDSVSYKEGITVTDNMDENASLEVDNSAVNLNETGEYTIIYKATDAAGNTSTAEAKLVIEEKPEGYVEPDVVLEMANEILDSILTDDMNQAEAAQAIYRWVRGNIGYAQSEYKESWTGGAYIGFTERRGDCYIFFSTAKALLTAAGIENIDVEKQDTSHSRHYWSMINVGTGWYHYDTTNFASGAIFFMVTDAELDDYSASHNESHNRDKSLYPATPETEFDMDSPDILNLNR